MFAIIVSAVLYNFLRHVTPNSVYSYYLLMALLPETTKEQCAKIWRSTKLPFP